jgi:hypothetical protein
MVHSHLPQLVVVVVAFFSLLLWMMVEMMMRTVVARRAIFIGGSISNLVRGSLLYKRGVKTNFPNY